MPARGEQRQKLRMTVVALLLGFVLAPLELIDDLVHGKVSSAAALGLMMVGMATMLVWLRRRGWSEVLGHAIGLCLSLRSLAYVFEGGSTDGAPVLSLIAIPVVMFFLLGIRGGWLWCGVSVSCYVVLGIRVHEAASAELNRIISMILITVGLSGIAHAFEVLRRMALVEIEQARDEAHASAEAKSQFLANMSHEIRTPLNGVLGMLGITLDTRLDPDQRSYLETAHGSGMALLDLLNEVLDFSKMNAGQMVLEATPFDLRTTVEEVLDQAAALVTKKDLELAALYVPGTPTQVVGDHGRIRQILLNLVSNAVKFTDAGHVLVKVEKLPGGEGAPLLRCSVEDTGIGIPAEKHALIFDVFRQVDGSTTRARTGSGLGLAIVNELVRLMGGRLGLESEPGKGSKFSFELALPLAVDPSPAPESLAELAGLRVLIVDDREVNRWVLQEQLVGWGLRTEQCDSAEQALELLRQAAARHEPYDLALLDYQLPRVDGMALARAIKADASIRGVTWVMLSSILQRPSGEELRAADCAAYLVKPVHQSDLRDVLAAVWATRGSPQALPLTRPPRSPSDGPVESVVPGLRVLVAEDNAVNQKVAQRMLVDLGCRVDVAGNGIEALELVSSMPYDIVFMDVQMPQMDGLEATQALRRREASTGEHIYVVAMTAHAMPEDRERCLTAGMDDYLSKPIKRRDLVRLLRTCREPSTATALLGATESDVGTTTRELDP